MKKVFGHVKGLKSGQLRRIENLYRRRTPPACIITPELGRDLSRLSREVNRQIALLFNRKGKVAFVIVGDYQRIVIPEMREYRSAPDRLNGLKCVHTHLNAEALTREDLTDLALLRLDLMAAVTVDPQGLPQQVFMAHVLPGAPEGRGYRLHEPLPPNRTDIQCDELIQSLEAELRHLTGAREAGSSTERALLISVTTDSRKAAADAMAELLELVASSGIEIVETVIQQRPQIDSRTLVGSGKLNEMAMLALQKGATLLIFNQELNPSQIRNLTDRIALKVIDRTQLILDIFAQRARSAEGKLQVELAQLKYLLPRLITKNTAMSRLTGGIGGRGPGETKLEINRRRVRARILKLERSLEAVRRQRQQQKGLRSRKALPVISIIGYTNAGKSTLLNTLTRSDVLAERRLFSTLDPTSRRLKFPRDTEVIITDTVGFIKNLPEDLRVAFRATLEELDSADLLLHVIDISNPRHPAQIQSVEALLEELGLSMLPLIRVLNKKDRVDPARVRDLEDRYQGVAVCARENASLMPLIRQMEKKVGAHSG